jgi:hypothetical protein
VRVILLQTLALQSAASETTMSSVMFGAAGKTRESSFATHQQTTPGDGGVDTSATRVLQEERLNFPSQLGPVAQLGARMTGSHEVEGSNPSRSTNSFIKR